MWRFESCLTLIGGLSALSQREYLFRCRCRASLIHAAPPPCYETLPWSIKVDREGLCATLRGTDVCLRERFTWSRAGLPVASLWWISMYGNCPIIDMKIFANEGKPVMWGGEGRDAKSAYQPSFQPCPSLPTERGKKKRGRKDRWGHGEEKESWCVSAWQYSAALHEILFTIILTELSGER